MSEGLLLIRRRRPIGERAALRPVGDDGAATLEGTAGAGRVVHAMSAAGIGCESVLQLVVPPDVETKALAGIDLGGTFDTVALGSHLVNLPDDTSRSAFLGLAARHVAENGALVVEHHPIDWAESAAAEEPTPGSALGMVDVRRNPPFVSAVSVFDIGGRVVRQPFTARVLSDAELAEALVRVGFKVARRLSPTFLEATRQGA